MLVECDAETYLKYIKDDPVRPNLFEDNTKRFTDKFRVFANVDSRDNVLAIICVALAPFLPQTESQLQDLSEGVFDTLMRDWKDQLDFFDANIGTVLCPYSLWSYEPKAGRTLVNELLEAIPLLFPDVSQVITMSPPTQMAMKFHLSNGAEILSINGTTINYIYEIPEQVAVH